MAFIYELIGDSTITIQNCNALMHWKCFYVFYPCSTLRFVINVYAVIVSDDSLLLLDSWPIYKDKKISGDILVAKSYQLKIIPEKTKQNMHYH